MRRDRGTYWLREDTMDRLRAFSERSGLTQSKLVDSLLSEGLDHLERNWPSELPVRGAFSKSRVVSDIRKANPKRKAPQKAVI
jgi:hypothetical protein